MQGVTDWQGLLQRKTPEGRELPRRLLVGRPVFTPREDENGRYYEFTGQGSILGNLGQRGGYRRWISTIAAGAGLKLDSMPAPSRIPPVVAVPLRSRF